MNNNINNNGVYSPRHPRHNWSYDGTNIRSGDNPAQNMHQNRPRERVMKDIPHVSPKNVDENRNQKRPRERIETPDHKYSYGSLRKQDKGYSNRARLSKSPPGKLDKRARNKYGTMSPNTNRNKSRSPERTHIRSNSTHHPMDTHAKRLGDKPSYNTLSPKRMVRPKSRSPDRNRAHIAPTYQSNPMDKSKSTSDSDKYRTLPNRIATRRGKNPERSRIRSKSLTQPPELPSNSYNTNTGFQQKIVHGRNRSPERIHGRSKSFSQQHQHGRTNSTPVDNVNRTISRDWAAQAREMIPQKVQPKSITDSHPKAGNTLDTRGRSSKRSAPQHSRSYSFTEDAYKSTQARKGESFADFAKGVIDGSHSTPGQGKNAPPTSPIKSSKLKIERQVSNDSNTKQRYANNAYKINNERVAMDVKTKPSLNATLPSKKSSSMAQDYSKPTYHSQHSADSHFTRRRSLTGENESKPSSRDVNNNADQKWPQTIQRPTTDIPRRKEMNVAKSPAPSQRQLFIEKDLSQSKIKSTTKPVDHSIANRSLPMSNKSPPNEDYTVQGISIKRRHSLEIPSDLDTSRHLRAARGMLNLKDRAYKDLHGGGKKERASSVTPEKSEAMDEQLGSKPWSTLGRPNNKSRAQMKQAAAGTMRRRAHSVGNADRLKYKPQTELKKVLEKTMTSKESSSNHKSADYTSRSAPGTPRPRLQYSTETQTTPLTTTSGGDGQRDRGIYIKSVVPGGGAAADGRLQAGDQLLEVDSKNLIGLTQEKAAEMMTQTSNRVTLKVAKQGAIYHGLATVLSQQSPIMQRAGPHPSGPYGGGPPGQVGGPPSGGKPMGPPHSGPQMKGPRPMSEDVSRFGPPNGAPSPDQGGFGGPNQGAPPGQRPINMQYGAKSSPALGPGGKGPNDPYGMPPGGMPGGPQGHPMGDSYARGPGGPPQDARSKSVTNLEQGGAPHSDFPGGNRPSASTSTLPRMHPNQQHGMPPPQHQGGPGPGPDMKHLSQPDLRGMPPGHQQQQRDENNDYVNYPAAGRPGPPPQQQMGGPPQADYVNQRDLKNQTSQSQSMHNLRGGPGGDDMNHSRVREWQHRNDMANNQPPGAPGQYHSLQRALDPQSTIRGQKIGPRPQDPRDPRFNQQPQNYPASSKPQDFPPFSQQNYPQSQNFNQQQQQNRHMPPGHTSPDAATYENFPPQNQFAPQPQRRPDMHGNKLSPMGHPGQMDPRMRTVSPELPPPPDVPPEIPPPPGADDLRNTSQEDLPPPPMQGGGGYPNQNQSFNNRFSGPPSSPGYQSQGYNGPPNQGGMYTQAPSQGGAHPRPHDSGGASTNTTLSRTSLSQSTGALNNRPGAKQQPEPAVGGGGSKKPPPPIKAKPKLNLAEIRKGFTQSPWEREEKERETRRREDEMRHVRDMEIEELESKTYLSKEEQDRLRRLRLDREFDKRVTEVDSRDNNDDDDDDITPAARAKMLGQVKEDMERKRKAMEDADKRRSEQARQSEIETNERTERRLAQFEQEREEQRQRQLRKQQQAQKEQEEILKKQREKEQMREIQVAREAEERAMREREEQMRRQFDRMQMSTNDGYPAAGGPPPPVSQPAGAPDNYSQVLNRAAPAPPERNSSYVYRAGSASNLPMGNGGGYDQRDPRATPQSMVGGKKSVSFNENLATEIGGRGARESTGSDTSYMNYPVNVGSPETDDPTSPGFAGFRGAPGGPEAVNQLFDNHPPSSQYPGGPPTSQQQPGGPSYNQQGMAPPTSQYQQPPTSQFNNQYPSSPSQYHPHQPPTSQYQHGGPQSNYGRGPPQQPPQNMQPYQNGPQYQGGPPPPTSVYQNGPPSQYSYQGGSGGGGGGYPQGGPPPPQQPPPQSQYQGYNPQGGGGGGSGVPSSPYAPNTNGGFEHQAQPQQQAPTPTPRTPQNSNAGPPPVLLTNMDTPGVVGGQEVYRDPRERMLAEKQKGGGLIVPGSGERMSFRDKMKMFASEAGENTPADRSKASFAQRRIDAQLKSP